MFDTRGLTNSGDLLTILVYLSSRGASGMSLSAGKVEVTVSGVSVDVVDNSEGSSAETVMGKHWCYKPYKHFMLW